MLPLLLFVATAARADTPLAILHLDPGVATAAASPLALGLTAKLEFPIAWFALHTVPVFLGALDGRRAVDEVLAPAPPLSPQYLLFARRGLAPDDRLDWGGGLGLRLRPLASARALAPPARGLWADLGGRYGTAGWGLDAGLGWDLPLGPVLALGPALAGVWDRRGLWGAISLSLSVSLSGEQVGGRITLPGS